MSEMDTEVKAETKPEITDSEMVEAVAANGAPEGPGGDGPPKSHSHAGNEDKKIFVGGISYETTNEDLLTFFGTFGEVTQAQVKFDQMTGRSRGFAFVEFASPDSVSEVLKQKNRDIKGKTVEVKPAKSRENKKIFVGGLPSDFPEEELKEHFEVYGKVDDVEWPWDRSRGLRRNFAFVVFEEENAADKASAENKQKFGDRMCDVKKAVPQPKRAMMGMGGMGAGRGGRGGARGGRGGWGGQYGGGGWGGGYGGGWGDWYGGGYGGAGGYGGYGGAGGYGGGYGGAGGESGYDYTSNDNYNYWGGWGQYGGQPSGAASGGAAAAAQTAGAGGYDSYSQASGAAAQAGGAPAGRGGRYQPY